MELMQELESVGRSAEASFSGLSEAQINWKPETHSWSIAQCLQHIIKTDKTYFPVFDSIITQQYQPGFFQRMHPFKKAIGRMMVRNLGPDTIKKFSAPKIFEPSEGKIAATIITDFSKHQETLQLYFMKLQALDMDKIYISSPVSPLLVFFLEDALKVIVVHGKRHIEQAKRIINNTKFPM